MTMDFSEDDIRRACGAHAFSRGSGYQRLRRVLKLAMNDDGLLIGSVQGTERRPYRQTVEVQQNGHGVDIMGECTCPIGFNCKHVAALLLEALVRAPAHWTAVAPAMDKAKPALSQPLQDWLASLDAATRPERGNEYPAQVRHRLIYVLQPSPAATMMPGVGVELYNARLLKDDRLEPNPSRYNAENAWNANPARFLRDSDLTILRRLSLNQRGQARAPHACPLHGREGTGILWAILETGRCRWRHVHGPALAPGAARRAEPRWQATEDGSQRFSLAMEGDMDDILPLAPPHYVDVAAGLCGPVDTGLTDTVAAALLEVPPVPAAEAEAVGTALAERFPGSPQLVPRVFRRTEKRRTQPVPHLRLFAESLPKYYYGGHWPGGGRRYEPDAGRFEQVALARLSFDYDGVEVSHADRRRELAVVDGDRLTPIVRSTKVERAAYKRLTDYGYAPVPQLYLYNVPPDHTNDLALIRPNPDLTPLASEEALITFAYREVPKLRAEGWRVDIDPDYPFQVAIPDADDWSMEVTESSGTDWFGVDLGVTVNGERLSLLPILLGLLRSTPGGLPPEPAAGETAPPLFVPLEGGRHLALPADRVRPILQALYELYGLDGIAADGTLRVTREQAADLAELEAATAAAGLRWMGAERLREVGQRLRGLTAMPEVPVPAGFHGTLRDYQRAGYHWLQFLRDADLGGILADDMGLGKTVQALAHIAAEKEAGRLERPALIVAPTSLMANWRREAARFAPELRVLTLHGPDRAARFEAVAEHDLVLTTYALLPRDRDTLLAHQWHLLILDEAQMIKNPQAQATQVVQQLSARHRLCLTGTPLENHLGELWSLFHVLMPGFLGDSRRFSRVFRRPIERGRDAERQALLARRVAPFLLRRTKDQVAAELPPKTELVEYVDLDGPQRDLYESVRLSMHDKVRREVARRGLAQSHITILDALLKLRQICCDPRLLKMAAAAKVRQSAKLERLMDMVPELVAEGRRILLFSQFTSMLALIEEALDRQRIGCVKLTGQSRDRETPIGRFQDGEAPLFLISLKAGGTGLNLTAADTVIHYDPWWNPAVENQATDRAHRIGQDKAVFVFKLLTTGTVEEKIQALQQHKRELADGLFDPEAKAGTALSEEDLDQLFAPLEG